MLAFVDWCCDCLPSFLDSKSLPRDFLRRSWVWVSGARLYLAIIPKRDLKEVEFLKDSSYARESEGTDVLVVPRK
jgi:hypothetical protein